MELVEPAICQDLQNTGDLLFTIPGVAPVELLRGIPASWLVPRGSMFGAQMGGGGAFKVRLFYSRAGASMIDSKFASDVHVYDAWRSY